MNKLKIGFVILTWNSEKVIGKCLRSIANLASVCPYVIVIDNGSSDNTHSIVRQYRREFAGRFQLLKFPKNVGTTISRNAGIRKLRGRGLDFICILDSDTEVNDEALQLLNREMQLHPEYGIIGPTLVTSGGVVQMSARCFPTALEKLYKACPFASVQAKGEAMEKQTPADKNAVSYPVDYLMSACWLVKPEVFEQAGLLDETIFYAPEDAEFCIRVWKAGYQIAFCPGARIIHEWQRISKRKLISRMNWEHIKGLCYMFRKHHYLISADSIRRDADKG